MRKSNDTLKIMMVIVAITLSWQAYAAGVLIAGDVINVDFASYQTPGTGWNTIGTTGGSIADAVTANGDSTGVSVRISDSFGADSYKGTASPDPALGFPVEATSDYFWGDNGNSTAQVMFSNLDPSLIYQLTIFASRPGVSDIRETQYAISGAGGLIETLYLNASNNTDTAVTSQFFSPTASGDITIDVQHGPNNNSGGGYYYVNLMSLKAVDIYSAFNPAPAVGAEVSPSQVLTWQQQPSVAGQGISYTVYFGSDPATYDQAAVKTTTADPSDFFHDPDDAALEVNTIYYWRVDSNLPGGEVLAGTEWNFIVAPDDDSGFWESFEDFTGASGTTVNGFAGDGASGVWTGDSNAVVIVRDDTAFSGTNYLRILDDDGSQHHVTKTFSSLIPLGITKARLSFAVRRTPIEGQTVTMTGVNFSLKATTADEPGDTGTMLLTQDIFPIVPSPKDNVWYTWEMDVVKRSDNKVYFTNLEVTDTSNRDIVYSDPEWRTSPTVTDEDDSLSWFRMFTGSSSQGCIDIDAIRLGRLPEKTVQAFRPSMPYRAYYGAGTRHHHQTLGVPGSGDARLLQDHGISSLLWAYGTQVGWEAGPDHWGKRSLAEERFWRADARYPYDYIGPGIALDEWVGSKYDEAPQWIYEGLTTAKTREPDFFAAIWANGWGDQEMYDMTLDNTVDLIMTEGYTMNPHGGAGGTWSDAIREMEDCFARGIERKTVLGLGHVTDLENYGGGYWDEQRFRYYMEYIKEEFPKSPGIAFFPDDVGDPGAYNAVLDLAGRMAREYWPDNWVPDGVYAVTPQVNTDCRMDAYQHGTANGTAVRMCRSNYPNDMTGQQWRFREVGEGVYRIQPAYCRELSLAVAGGDSANGTRVRLWQNNYSHAQKWRLIPAGFGFHLEPLCAPGKYLTAGAAGEGADFTIHEPVDDPSQLFAVTPEFCKLDPVVYYVQGEDGQMAGGTYYSSGGWDDRGSRGGFVNFPNSSGASVTFTNVEGFDGGEQELFIRYSLNSDTTKSLYLTVNGQISVVPVPSTGAWYNWRKLRLRRQLNPGRTNTIRLTSNSTGDFGNVDAIGVEPLADPVIIQGDFDSDQDIDAEDLDSLAANWLSTSCTPANNWCGGIDLDLSGKVDLSDWAVFAANWLGQ